MITKKQKLSLSYALVQSMFLGAAYSHIFSISGKDAWLSIILGILIGIAIVYIIKHILKNKGNKNLNELLKDMGIIGIMLKIIVFTIIDILELMKIIINFKLIILMTILVKEYINLRLMKIIIFTMMFKKLKE